MKRERLGAPPLGDRRPGELRDDIQQIRDSPDQADRRAQRPRRRTRARRVTLSCTQPIRIGVRMRRARSRWPAEASVYRSDSPILREYRSRLLVSDVLCLRSSQR